VKKVRRPVGKADEPDNLGIAAASIGSSLARIHCIKSTRTATIGVGGHRPAYTAHSCSKQA
jgi:hypothetical protein